MSKERAEGHLIRMEERDYGLDRYSQLYDRDEHDRQAEQRDQNRAEVDEDGHG